MKISPGPWRDTRDGETFGPGLTEYDVYDSEGRPVFSFSCGHCSDNPSGFHDSANRRLIMAAPELLGALKGCVLTDRGEGGPVSKWSAVERQRAIDLIRRIEGEE
jgi:hypothetical protein